MATNTLPQRLQINGLIDTNDNVVSNMEKIARNATSYVSYDTANGRWSVVINRAGTSVQAFDDSNIVGPINITGKDITELYNRAVIKYPLRDTADTTETIVLEIPSGDRSVYEKDRTLEITYDMVNEPVQAQLLGLIELKQSRVDTIVTFTSDYSTINVQAGDIIDITNSHHGWTNKLFRVVSLEEIESDEGQITISYQCLEYDADVYDETALSRYIRTDRTDIKSVGVISAPTAPVVTVSELEGDPHQNIELVVPEGVIESMELWASKDGTNWELNKVVRPADDGKEAQLTPGDTMVVRRSYSTISREWATGSVGPSGSYTVYWKYRGMNAYGSGPFSSATSKAWEPKITAESGFVGASYLTDAGVETVYTTGEIAAIAEASLGTTAGTSFTTATGITAPNKDTGASASTNIDIAVLTSLNLTALNTALANVCGTATQSGYVPATPGAVNYLQLTYATAYNARALSAVFSMPYGTYDYQLFDASTGSFAVHTGQNGYVPTQLTTQFKPSGSSTYYDVRGVITHTAVGSISIDVSNDDIFTATAGPEQTNDMTGDWRWEFDIFDNTVPTAVGIVGIGNIVYPYNWNVAAYSNLQPELVIKYFQF